MSEKQSYYLTTPIYYVNGVPHLGTAYTTIASDALARFERAVGRDVWFLTGLDEHGQKVAQKAAEEGVTAQEWVDSVAPQFKEAWAQMDITYDDFIRTTEPRHIRGVQQFFQTLYNNGFIYKDNYQGYYCVPEETFFTGEQLAEFAQRRTDAGEPFTTETGEKLCPDCGRPLSFVEEDNLFFKLSAFEDKLLAYYDANPDFVQPEIRRNEVISFVKSGLKDLSVSRTTFDWGVPIPFASGHVSYVWVDALINYITAVGYGDPSPEAQEMFAQRWPAQIHFVGKDIIRFHCVIWPAMLMAAGLEPPRKVFAHGFLLTKGEKMSKSTGNAMSPADLVDIFGVDAYRYYFLSDVQFGSDGSISLERMLQVYNADLANSWGNLCSRALNMTAKYLDGQTPDLWEKTVVRLTAELGNPLAELVNGSVNPTNQQPPSLHSRYAAAFESVDYSGAMAVVQELVSAANLYIENSAPWTLAKAAAAEAREDTEAAEAAAEDEGATTALAAPTAADRLAFVLYNILESIRIAALLFAPVMPNTSAEVWRRLGLGDIAAVQDQVVAAAWGGLPANLQTTVGEPLFMRLTEDELGIK
ncbi:methionine--tRNA ligase [Actinomycetota bacterium]|nr:methionine--tRNA ligase [Actinomycetota bacterium]